MAFLNFLSSMVTKVPLSLSFLSLLVVIVSLLLFAIAFSSTTISTPKTVIDLIDNVKNFYKFFYASFLKPHTGDDAVSGQQAALESFYKAQVRHGPTQQNKFTDLRTST